MEAELAITKAELEKYSKKLKMQAYTLTGLANRRKITELLKEEIKKLEEDNNNNFNIIMLDIDFFKKVNDNYGHPMGDEVIKKVSNHMQDKVGSEGVVGRFGGEEFLTILYNNDIQQAALLADQIRSDIESKKIEFEGKQISVTVSMGLVLLKQWYTKNLNKADERLYKAQVITRILFLLLLIHLFLMLAVLHQQELLAHSFRKYLSLGPFLNHCQQIQLFLRPQSLILLTLPP